MTMKHCIKTKRQGGAVLIVALVLLLVLTVLGTAGLQDTTMEERMAGNFRDENIALQAAEYALRLGEAELGDPVTYENLAFVVSGANGLYDLENEIRNKIPGDTGSFGRHVSASDFVYDGDSLVNAPPEYYIEKLPKTTARGDSETYPKKKGQIQFYRVTARGFGVSPNTEVVLQSTYYVQH